MEIIQVACANTRDYLLCNNYFYQVLEWPILSCNYIVSQVLYKIRAKQGTKSQEGQRAKSKTSSVAYVKYSWYRWWFRRKFEQGIEHSKFRDLASSRHHRLKRLSVLEVVSNYCRFYV